MTAGGPSKQRGFALLIVLWALVPLALMFTMLASTALSTTRSAGDLRAAARLEAAADGAIYTALFEQLQRGRTAATPVEARREGADVAVEVADLSGLLNPNGASPALLQALLRRLGVPDDDAAATAGAIVDWRTPGRRRSQNGAKTPEYPAGRARLRTARRTVPVARRAPLGARHASGNA